MLYPRRYEAAHNARVKALRAMAALTVDTSFDVPLRYVRYVRPAVQEGPGRTRGWYVVNFGHGEVALERGQVELFLLGMCAGLGVVVPHVNIKEFLDALVHHVGDDEEVPKPWTS